MSMSDTCIEASRELLRYMKGAGTSSMPDRGDPIARAIVLMLIYVVAVEGETMNPPATDERIKEAILVFRQHLEDTPDWGDVASRIDDFNIIHAALKDPEFKPEYISLVKH